MTAEQNRFKQRGGRLGVVLVAVTLLVGVGLIALGVGDPFALPAGEGEVLFQGQMTAGPSITIDGGRWLIPADRSLVQVLVSSTAADVDLVVDTGPQALAVNPAGYVAWRPTQPLTPFPHVRPDQNELIFILGARSTQLQEIWINRELFWRGSVPVAAEWTLHLTSFDDPAAVEIEVVSYP